MVTLRAHVKWLDRSKGFDVGNADEAGHPDVFINNATLRAAGIKNANHVPVKSLLSFFVLINQTICNIFTASHNLQLQ
jgi:hypothetical protein